ncbi:MAG: hypothetical protein OEM93_00175 [Rhodospirillales bacterium]|nr:hypothetical protein [Rhodospirillales bacterium]
MRHGLVKRACYGVLVAALIFGPRVVTEYYAPDEIGVVATLSVLLVPMALAGAVGSLVMIGFRGLRRQALNVMVPCLAFLLASAGMLRLQGEARSLAFEKLAERSRPLVEAIGRYERERDAPPHSLDSLVPDYLDEIPETGIEACPEYDYEAVVEIADDYGQSSGRRVARVSRWELRVHCPIGFLNWDVFFYWPTQDYPDGIYGGAIERIADWAYVHE